MPSSTPSNPAPGRRLLIIRDDSVPAPGGVFLSFDGIVPASTSEPTAYQRYTSLSNINSTIPSPTALKKLPDRPASPPKKRWTLLRGMNPFSSSPASPKSNKSGPDTAITPKPAVPSSLDSSPPQALAHMSRSESSSETTTSAHISHSFKFSLEWVDRNAPPLRDRRLYPPRLPQPAQTFLYTKRPEPTVFEPVKPIGHPAGTSKYCGRALAEWAILVTECHNFYERRKLEGVPGIKFMETPTLGIESFRKPMG